MEERVGGCESRSKVWPRAASVARFLDIGVLQTVQYNDETVHVTTKTIRTQFCRGRCVPSGNPWPNEPGSSPHQRFTLPTKLGWLRTDIWLREVPSRLIHGVFCAYHTAISVLCFLFLFFQHRITRTDPRCSRVVSMIIVALCLPPRMVTNFILEFLKISTPVASRFALLKSYRAATANFCILVS